MRWELKTIQWSCDFCSAKTTVLTANADARPAGWGTKAVGGFGSTGYTKIMDCCPACDHKVLKHEGDRFVLEDKPAVDTVAASTVLG